jgi:exonuclease SbcD
MRILHTADWHLGDRLGRIDRTPDLRRAVERIGEYCACENIDVLLVAGDLFSELARSDSLRESIEHWQSVFGEFLGRGGTIVALTGNHDNENFCRTLQHAMSLAAPLPGDAGTLAPAGRLYLAAEPTLMRLADPAGGEVQFILMPYPTPARYLRNEASRRYASLAEKNQKLHDAFLTTLRELQAPPRFDRAVPAILSAHVNVRGAQIGAGLFRLAEEDDVLVDAAAVGADFAYVALGHIHKPQCLGGQKHVRYCGSIERLDLGERDDTKSVVVFEISGSGLVGEPRLLPMDATPIYDVDISDPTANLEELKNKYAECAGDLVNLHIRYTAGVDSLEHLLRELEAIFPRWYNREWKETTAVGESLANPDSRHGGSFEQTVREFVRTELQNHDDSEVRELLDRLEALLQEMTA